MSIESRSKKYGKALGHWQVEEALGSGSGGRSMVFSVRHQDAEPAMYSAMKVVTLIEERGTFESLPPFRQEEYTAASREICRQATREVQLMEQLRGKTNIVDYLDHRFMRWQDTSSFGMDLLIRMEKLTDLRSQLRQDRHFSPEEIRRVARDLCRALSICHGKNILHRDIKPENIFFNRDGDYKLGDFGIARIMNDSPSHRASTDVGTAAYAPPEQSSGHYDHRVDIYSLGMVLYELANGNRLPFADSVYITERDIQIRLSGAPLPPPCNTAEADPELTGIILKACAFRPEDRFGSAEELLRVLNREPEPIRADPPVPPEEDPYATRPAMSLPFNPPPANPPRSYEEELIFAPEMIIPEKKSGKLPVLLGLVLALLALAAGALLILGHFGRIGNPRQEPTFTTCISVWPESERHTTTGGSYHVH